MHTFRSHENKPGIYRRHWRFGLPMNPVCWLFGHRGRARIESFGSAGELLLEECRWCGRRWRDPDGLVRLTKDPTAQRERAVRIAEARLENARRDPRSIEAQISGREGFRDHEYGFNIEVVYYPRYHSAWRWRQVLDNLGFRIHFGDRGSETPYDLSAHFGVGSAYLTVEAPGRFAEWVGRGHKRDLSLRTHGGSVWWQVWYDDDGGHDRHHDCGRRRFCLRDGHVELNPLDAIWGGKRYHYEDVGDPVAAFVEIEPGERYLVDLQLQRVELRRDRGPALLRRPQVVWAVDWSCPGGIPFRNHSWKGDNALGSSVRVDSDYGRPPSQIVWVPEAVAKIRKKVRVDRGRYGYRAPVKA